MVENTQIDKVRDETETLQQIPMKFKKSQGNKTTAS